MAFDESSPRLSRILKYVAMLWAEGKAKHPDISIKVGDQSFGAHRIILICHSDYLCDKIVNNQTVSELTIPPEFGITPEAFREVLEFMYKSELALVPEKLYELQNVAQKLGMYHITKLCESLAVPTAIPQAPTDMSQLKKEDREPTTQATGLQMPWGGEDYFNAEKGWQPSLRPSTLAHYMKYLWHSRLQESADFTITVSGQSFKAHKFVLSCHSYYFADLFRKAPHLNNINLPSFLNLQPAVVQELLKFMYIQDLDVNIDPAMVQALHGAADTFKMVHLVKLLEERFSDKPMLKGRGVMPNMMPNFQYPMQSQGVMRPEDMILAQGQQQQQMTFQSLGPSQPMAQLKQGPPMSYSPSTFAPIAQPAQTFQPSMAQQQIQQQQQQMQQQQFQQQQMQQQQFQQQQIQQQQQQAQQQLQAQYNLAQQQQPKAMGEADIVNMLSADSVPMRDEMEVFQAAVEWLRSQSKPQMLVFKVMACVRFYLIPKAQLQDCVRMTKDWFMNIGEYRDLIITADWLLSNQKYGLEPLFVGTPRQRMYGAGNYGGFNNKNAGLPNANYNQPMMNPSEQAFNQGPMNPILCPGCNQP